MAVSARDDHEGPERDVAYALPGAGVAVHTDDSELQCWLDEFLAPGFDRFVPVDGDPTVVVTSGAGWSGSPAYSTNDLGARPCFALDREVVEYPVCRDDGAIVVTDSKYGARYRIEADAVTVVRDDHAPRSRAAVMRVVRELATARALADGSRLQLHASALEHDGSIIVFAGPKEAGKTTLVARLASVGELAIAGNDRLLAIPPVDESSGRSGGQSFGWRVRPIPSVVSIRPQTQAILSGLFGDIPAVPSPAHLTMRELDAVLAEHGAHDPGLRLKLSPAQFARAVGVPLSGEGRLARVCLVSVDPVLDGFAVEPWTSAAARPFLDAVRYGSRPDGNPRTIFEEWLGVARPPGADRMLLDRLAESVAVCALRVGPSVLHDDGVAAELLGNVLAHA